MSGPQVHDKKFVNHDLTAERCEFLWKAPAFLHLEDLILDKRDAPMVHLLFDMTVTTVPLVLLNMFFLREMNLWFRNLVGILSIVWNYGIIFGRWNDMMHYSEHRVVFKNKWMHKYINTFMSPFMGVPMGLYQVHHVVMHHVEANLFPYDITSTLPYQRDNIKHWIGYALKFAFACWINLPRYAMKRGRWDLVFSFTYNACIYWTILYFAYSYNALGAFYTFTLPYLVTFLFYTFGNWSQHIFVKPEEPDSAFGMTYCCVNDEDNQRTFNDGYHIVHHLHSKLHWSEMPKFFEEHLDEFARHDSFVFHTRHFLAVGWWVFAGNYDKLYNHVVFLPGQKQRSKEEFIAECKRRLAPINESFDKQLTQ